jgi:uncharacterized YigZ family protein
MLFANTYTIITAPQSSVYKSKGSRFLAFALPIKSELDAKTEIQKLKQIYPDASHHCYAYVLQFDKSLLKTNDDGEPANTAGKPILRQIQKHDLTNILVVVVRYFGGTLLGVSGLIEAYGKATEECLAICEKSVKLIFEKYEICCEYGLEQEIYKACKQFNGIIHVIENQDLFCAKIKIPLQMVEGFKSLLQKNYKIQFKYIGIA